MIQFLRDYWQYIFYAVLLSLSFLTLVLKRRSKVEIIDNSFWSDIITAVQEAENLYGAGTGFHKLHFVIEKVLSAHGLDSDNVALRNLFISMVEVLLTTPQKKEIKNEKK